MKINVHGAVVLAPRPTQWYCPNCPQTAITFTAGVHTRFHVCRTGGPAAGLTAPMLRVGTDAKVIAVVREDYVGREHVQTNAHGQPIMSVVTERADGSNDCAVYVPCATARAEEIE